MESRRIWTEFLSPEILAAPATIALLQRYQLQPLIAMPPGRDAPEMVRALQQLQQSGVKLGLWPLLSDADGYWPGSANAELALERVAEVRQFAREAEISIATIVMDLEPPLALKRHFHDSDAWQKARILGSRLWESRSADSRKAHAEAVQAYGGLADGLREAGIESLAIAVPPLLLDLAGGTEFWQACFATPLTGPRWDTQSPMFYRSMIQAALPGQDELLGRALFAEACRLWSQSGTSVCMSLGVVGGGKFENEASYESPADLAWDLACARNLGLRDFALFSLESILGRSNPEAWLDAFTRPSPRWVASLRDRMARRSLRGLLACAAILTGRFQPRPL